MFCASLADVFEDYWLPVVDKSRIINGMPCISLGECRAGLFRLIDKTPNLDWLLLTKLPDNANRFWLGGRRTNVWVGTSVSNQKTADELIPQLLKLRNVCSTLFVSFEPALEVVDFSKWLPHYEECSSIEWLICGGESGPHARPMLADVARSARDQCLGAGASFFFKQWGEWLPGGQSGADGYENRFLSTVERVGKKSAGRNLDGREWNEIPQPLVTGVVTR